MFSLSRIVLTLAVTNCTHPSFSWTSHHSSRNSWEVKCRRERRRWDFNLKGQHEDAPLVLLLRKSRVGQFLHLFTGCWDAHKVTAVLISSTIYNELLNAMKGVLPVLIHMSHYFSASSPFFVVRYGSALQIYRDLLHHADEHKVNIVQNSSA